MNKTIAPPAVRISSVIVPLILATATSAVFAAPPPGDAASPGLYRTSGSFDTGLRELGGNYYSGTTRLNGSAIYALTQAYAAGRPLDDCDLEYMDKEVVGTDPGVANTRVTLLLGGTDNLYNLPSPHDESTLYGGLGIRWFNTIKLNAGTAYVGANLESFLTDKSPFGRRGGDNFLKDYGLDGGLFLNLGPSTGLAMKNSLNYSSFGSSGLGVARPGVHFDDLLSWNSETHLHYRFDGKGLNDPGLGASTGFLWTGFNERGGNYGDFTRAQLSQEFAWNCGTGSPTYYLNGRLGRTDWRTQGHFDADYYGGMIGLRSTCPSGTDYDVAFGAERWTYDDAGLRDRTSFRAEASVGGRLTDNLSLRFNAAWGIHPLLPNLGGHFIDAEGLRSQLRLTYSPDTNTMISLYGEWQDLTGDIAKNQPSADRNHQIIGLEYRRALSDSIVITPGILWMNSGGDGADSDALIGTLRTTFTF